MNIYLFFKLSNKTKFPVETTDESCAPVYYRTHVLQMLFLLFCTHQ